MTSPHLHSKIGAFVGTIVLAAKVLTNNSLAAGFVYTAGVLAVGPVIVTGIMAAHDAALRHEAEDRAQFASAGSPRPARQMSGEEHRASLDMTSAVDPDDRLPSLLISRTSFLIRYEGEPAAAAFVRSHLDDLIAEGSLAEGRLADAQGELGTQAKRLRSLDQRLIALRRMLSSAARSP